MLTKTEKSFTLIFSLIVFLELITNQFESLSQWHYAFKPMIVLSLIVFFLMQSKSLDKTIKYLTVLALICSVAGDIFLMFDEENPNYFILGLIAFLLAHVMYILVYLKHRNRNRKSLPFMIILIIYASGLFYLIKDGLGVMLIPVVIYMFVILTMAVTAFLRKGSVSIKNYNWVFLGAILFLISDSLLSVNMFFKPILFANILIMVTYSFAQYFIVLGILKPST